MNKKNNLLVTWDSNWYEFVPGITSPLLNGFFFTQNENDLNESFPSAPGLSALIAYQIISVLNMLNGEFDMSREHEIVAEVHIANVPNEEVEGQTTR